MAFLSCGAALQPILPKSQCWCISEANDRFVLQIRRPQYWRIEVPVSDPEDADRALVLKDVFDSILLFEKTECPFQRTFTVALPERPQTPVKKKPWTPVGKNLIWSPFSSDITPSPLLSGRIVGARRPKRPKTGDSEDRPQTPASLVRETPSDSPAESPLNSKAIDEQSVQFRKVNYTTTHALVAAGEKEEAKGARADTPKGTVQDVWQALAQALSENTKSLPAEHAGVGANLAADCGTASQERLPAVQGLAGSLLAKNQTTSSPLVACHVRAAVEDLELSGHTADQRVENGGSTEDHGRSRGTAPLTTVAERNGSDQPTDPPAAIGKGELELAVIGGSDDEGPCSFEGAGSLGAVNLKKKRMSHLLAGRSVSIRPQLTLVTPPPSESSQHPAAQKRPPREQHLPGSQPASLVAEETSDVESTDSFHSVQSWHSPITLPPSPPSSSPSRPTFPHPHENIVIPSIKQARELDASDLIFTPRTDVTLRPSSADATICTPRLTSTDSSFLSGDTEPTSTGTGDVARDASWTSTLTEQQPVRRRARASTLTIGRRGLSPLPPAADLFSTSALRRRPVSRLEAVRRLPGAIINKTVEILLSPPGHLVHLMLKVAARIAAGEWTGLVLGFGEGGESIPVHWDYSDDELSSWEDDDDFLFSMGPFARMRVASECSPNEHRDVMAGTADFMGNEDDRSWEVD